MSDVNGQKETGETLDLMWKLGSMEATMVGIARDLAQMRRDAVTPEKVQQIIKEEVGGKLSDHATRISALERWRWMVGGGVVLAVFLIGILPKIVSYLAANS